MDSPEAVSRGGRSAGRGPRVASALRVLGGVLGYFGSPRIDSSISMRPCGTRESPPDGVADVRQPTGPEEDQHDHQDDDELGPSDVAYCGDSS